MAHRMDLQKSKKGMTGVVGMVLTVGTVIIATVIVGILIAAFFAGVNTSAYSATAQTKLSSLESDAWTAIGLVGLVFLIIVGAFAISVLRSLGGG